MDIYKFINSKDIRKYLSEINYEFTPVEAVWLIWQCESITLTEKYNAWQEIIDTMPDMPFETDERMFDSLHSFLKNYIELENKWLSKFCEEEHNAIYTYHFDYDYDSTVCNNPETAFSKFSECYCDIKEQSNFYTDINLEYNHIIICKKYFGVKGNYFKIKVNSSFQILNVYSEELDNLRNISFEKLWFSFPTPFKKGDIVYDPKYPDNSSCFSGPFVFIETASDYYPKLKKKFPNGNSDMTASGYFQDSEGHLYDGCMNAYMNLEYYTEDLNDEKRILKVLSNYLKNKISFCLLVNAYHKILIEKYACNITQAYCDDERPELAGIREE